MFIFKMNISTHNKLSAALIPWEEEWKEKRKIKCNSLFKNFLFASSEND